MLVVLHGRVLSDETKKKISSSNKGHKWSDEHRIKYNKTLDKLAAENNGKKCRPETSEKISKSLIGNTRGFTKGFTPWHKGLKCPQLSGENNPNYGKHLSEEVRHKISETLKGTHLSEETKKKLGDNNRGRHWWTNGIENKFTYECPGIGFRKGKIHFKNK